MQGQLNRIENWTMLLETGNHPYKIFIAKPKPPPTSGYPVLYVLDGNASDLSGDDPDSIPPL